MAKYTLEELEEKIEDYFSKAEVPNKAGIRLTLAICRDTYCDWKKKGHQFSDTIKKIDDRIEQYWIERLNKPACTGAIFYLKNAFKENYKDRYEQHLTSKGEKIIPIYAGQSIQGYSSNKKDIQSKEED